MKKTSIIATMFLAMFIYAQDKPDECVSEEPVQTSIWYRPAPMGDVLKLDMSKGYSYADEYGVHIIILNLNSNELVDLVFPLNDYWFAEGSQWKNNNDNNNKSTKIERNHR